MPCKSVWENSLPRLINELIWNAKEGKRNKWTIIKYSLSICNLRLSMIKLNTNTAINLKIKKRVLYKCNCYQLVKINVNVMGDNEKMKKWNTFGTLNIPKRIFRDWVIKCNNRTTCPSCHVTINKFKHGNPLHSKYNRWRIENFLDCLVNLCMKLCSTDN